MAGIINLFYLPLIILFSGLLLALVTGIYFLLLQKTFFWAKEICVGFIYTFGLFIGPLAFSYPCLNISQWLLMPQVLMIAYANLLLFSWFDVLMDEQDGHRSMTIHWGKPGSEKTIKLLLSVGILVSVAIVLFNPAFKTFVMQLVIILMNIILAFVFRYNRIFRRNELYRVVGDGIFYLPLIYIFYAG